MFLLNPAAWKDMIFVGLPAWVVISQLFVWVCIWIKFLEDDSARRMQKLVSTLNFIASSIALVALFDFLGTASRNATLVVTLVLLLLALIVGLGVIRLRRDTKPKSST